MGTHLSLTLKTPDKMRVLLALTLLVAGALAGGKEKREMEMWMKMKAMEGCFGEDLVKDHMIKMKRSAAKCMRVETPELELPMFENSYRFANAMSRTPRGQGSEKNEHDEDLHDDENVLGDDGRRQQTAEALPS